MLINYWDQLTVLSCFSIFNAFRSVVTSDFYLFHVFRSRLQLAICSHWHGIWCLPSSARVPGSNRLSIVERIDYILCWPCAAKPCHSHILFFVEEPGGLFGAVVFSMPEASQRTYSCYLLLSLVTAMFDVSLMYVDVFWVASVVVCFHLWHVMLADRFRHLLRDKLKPESVTVKREESLGGNWVTTWQTELKELNLNDSETIAPVVSSIVSPGSSMFEGLWPAFDVEHGTLT